MASTRSDSVMGAIRPEPSSWKDVITPDPVTMEAIVATYFSVYDPPLASVTPSTTLETLLQQRKHTFEKEYNCAETRRQNLLLFRMMGPQGRVDGTQITARCNFTGWIARVPNTEHVYELCINVMFNGHKCIGHVQVPKVEITEDCRHRIKVAGRPEPVSETDTEQKYEVVFWAIEEDLGEAEVVAIDVKVHESKWYRGQVSVPKGEIEATKFVRSLTSED